MSGIAEAASASLGARREPLGADPHRCAEHLTRFAEITEPAAGPGVTRLAYTPLERSAHERFAAHMRELGLTVWTDAAGNTLAERAGSEPTSPAIGTGSHLDSVPQAGSYDGVAGVVASMELARLFEQHDIRHRHPLRFVVFAAEEGARFGQACTGSRIAGGLTRPGDLDDKRDAQGTSIATAMREVGLDPTMVDHARWQQGQWHAFIELHIEQGNVLASQHIPLGVVDQISGSTRLAVHIHGRASHTGGTPMHLRADALAAAAEVTLAGEALANDSRHRGTRITVGRLDVSPGSITTIPGECHLSVDVRDVDSDRQRDTAAELIEHAHAIAQRRGVEISVQPMADASPAVLPTWVREAIVDSCAALDLGYRVMPSGASHDTQMISGTVPAGMVFIPSHNHGVSHSPDEHSDAAELASGIEVLAASLLTLDDTYNAAAHSTHHRESSHA